MELEYLTAEEAGEILGCQRRRVCTLARAGRLKGQQVEGRKGRGGKAWLFARPDVERFLGDPDYHLRLVPTTPIDANHDQIVYFAGFFDGEGCVFLQPRVNRLNWYMGIIVSGCFRSKIHALPAIWGGQSRDLNIQGWNRLPQARWTANGRQGAMVLRLLLPYLDVKRPHAELAIEFQNRVDRGSHNGHRPIPPDELAWRAEAAERMKWLNHHYE